jgi:hypothetical protein
MLSLICIRSYIEVYVFLCACFVDVWLRYILDVWWHMHEAHDLVL